MRIRHAEGGRKRSVIHHVAFFKLNPDVTPARVEQMMRQTRAQLLKIGQVLCLHCGKNVEAQSDWGFFLAVEVESMEKLALFQESAIHIKFIERIIKPNTCARQVHNFEMDPARELAPIYAADRSR